MASAKESRLVDLHSLLQTGKFSDLKFSYEGHEFAVHKAIFCAQSRVFSAECEGGFEVGFKLAVGYFILTWHAGVKNERHQD